MIAAIVPAKALDQAKGRLAELLGEAERRRLALAMLEDVVSALKAVDTIDSIRVVSPDQEVLDRARDLAVVAVEEPPSLRGINQALSHALATIQPPPEAVVAVLADVPAVTAQEIARLIDEGTEMGVVICPSSAKGTSALLLRPPDVIPFRFGELSFQAHKRQAAALRIPSKVLHIESLEHDIDEPDDLNWLMKRGGDTATHRLLADIMPAGRTA